MRKTGGLDNGGYIQPLNKFVIYDDHVMLPVSISYDLGSNKRFSLSPGIGGAVMYNNFSKLEHPDEITAHFNTVSAAMSISLEARYKLNKHWSVIAGPSVQWMLTPVTPSARYDYAHLFNAGVRYSLPQKSDRSSTLAK